MPPVIAGALVAGGLAAGAAALGFSTLTIGAAFWSAAISTAVFGGVSYLLSKPGSLPSLTEQQRGLQQMVRAAAAPRRLIYGRARVGGVLVYAGATGKRNDVLHLAVALAGHEISAVERVLVNDLPADSERYVKEPALVAEGLHFVPEGGESRHGTITNYVLVNADDPLTAYRQETGPRLDRSGFTSGQVLHITGSAHNDGLYRVRATGKDDVSRYQLKIERLDGGEIVAETVEGALTLQERYLQVYTQLGRPDQEALPEMVAHAPEWTPAHRLRGIAYLYAQLAYRDSVWLSGIPNLTAVVRGKPVYDPRTERTEYSENPALIIADYLTLPRPLGLGVDYSEIDEDWLIASANICDERVGEVVLPEKRLYGVVVRPAVTVTRRRYECHAAIELSEDREQVLNKLAATMAGRVVYTGGRWRIMAGAYQTPTVHLDESHLRDRLRVQPRLSRQELANGVRGTYVSQADDFQPADFPPIQDPAALAEDNGEALWHDLECPYTLSGWHAQQLARIHLARTRQQITVQYPATLAGLRAVAGGTVAITNARMGWTEKPFEVIDWRLATYEDERGQPLLGVDLTLRETAPHAYQAVALFPDVPSQPTELPSPWDIPAVTGLTVRSGLDAYTVEPGGEIRSRARVEWAPSGDPRVLQYEVQYRRTNEDAWATAISLGAYLHIEPVYHGEELEVRVRARTALAAGAWASVIHPVVAITAPGGTPLPEILPVPDVRRLELYDQGNDTDFAGRDAKFVWGEASFTDPSARDLYFRDYQITVYDVETGRARCVAHTVDPEYTYTYERNVEDSARLAEAMPEAEAIAAGLLREVAEGVFAPAPRRQFRVEVVVRGRQGQVSARPAKLTVQNPAPKLPAGWNLRESFYTASAEFIPPTDTDFARINVYLSAEQGFTPSAANLAWQGADSPVNLPPLESGVTYYYRYEAEDAFGPGERSGELAFTTKLLEAADITGLGPWAEIEEADRAFIERWLAEDAIDEAKLADKAINLAGNKVTGQLQRVNLADAAVDASKLADLSVEAAKLANSAVTAEKIENLAVGTAAIANGAITNAKIANLAVETAQIADAAIASAKIADLAVTDAKIVDITATKIKSGTLLATTLIESEGLIRVRSGDYHTVLGPHQRWGEVMTLSSHDVEADQLYFAIRANGRIYARGADIEGTVAITGGNILGTAASTVRDNAAAGAAAAPRANAGLDAAGNVSRVISSANMVGGAAEVGLNLTPTHMGFYSGSSWSNYFAANGDALIGDAATEDHLEWDQSARTLSVGRNVQLRGTHAYNNRSLYYHTFIESLESWGRSAIGGGDVSRLAGGDGVLLRAPGNGDGAGIYRRMNYAFTSPLSFNRPTRFKVRIFVAGGSHSSYIAAGNRAGGVWAPSFGFHIRGNTLRGFCSRTTPQAEIALASVSGGRDLVLEAALIPGVRVEFYVDGVLAGTLSTNLPQGAISNGEFFSAYVHHLSGAGTGSPQITVGELAFLQEDF